MATQGHHIGQTPPPSDASQFHARGFDTIAASDYASMIGIGIEPGEFRNMTQLEIQRVLAACDLL